jgi:hypothetical protein
MNEKIYIDKRTLPFDYGVKKILLINNVRVALIEIQSKSIYNENIFAFDEHGKILWQIDKKDHVDRNSPYTNIYTRDNELWGYNWDGSAYKIDIKTGEIKGEKYLK